MLHCLGSTLRDRKARLFACACTRRVWRLLVLQASREAVEAAEASADGLLGDGELTLHWQRSNDARERLLRASALANRLVTGLGAQDDGQGEYSEEERAVAARGVNYARGAYEAALAAHDCTDGFSPLNLSEYVSRAARYAIGASSPGGGYRVYSDRDLQEEAAEASWQCHLLRDLVRRRHAPFSLAPAWLTPIVSSLAQAAYDERRLPYGDLDGLRLSVLADALEEAGASDEILTHLRSPSPHVRGCWALDLILGRT
jgi:hypothetical protein